MRVSVAIGNGNCEEGRGEEPKNQRKVENRRRKDVSEYNGRNVNVRN
jgi:hypothetical protein